MEFVSSINWGSFKSDVCYRRPWQYNEPLDTVIYVPERFIIIMFDRTSESTDLDSARKQLFTKKSRINTWWPATNIPCFELHVKRTVFQAVHCWSHCLKQQMPAIDPDLWRCNKQGDRWMTIPEIPQTCNLELIHCSCKKTCSAWCKCVKANVHTRAVYFCYYV